MRAADKVAEVDAVHWARLRAFAAACAERIVDSGEVVFNLDSTVGTSFLAFHTADTAV